jgi:DNA invertase Pin-like site-specific DNA recombinase
VATPPEPVATPPEPVAFPPEPVATPPEPVATPPEPVAFPPGPVYDEPAASPPVRLTAVPEPEPPPRVIGYMTTGSEAWSEEHERALAEIEAACQESSWNLVEIVWDRANGKTLDRPGLSHALEEIAAGEARGLVVRDLQRVTRSPHDLGALMAWFREAGATLVALDLGLDTSTPEGRQVARTLIALGKAEAPQGAAQTDEARGEARVTGRPAVKDRPELLERITAMRAANLSLQEIADQLNAENVPTLRGGRQWRPSSIQAALGYKRPGTRERLPPLDSRGSGVGG